MAGFVRGVETGCRRRTGLVVDIVRCIPAQSVSNGCFAAGLLTSSVPLCRGPGPDLNLIPTVVVVARQNAKATAMVRVPATRAAH